jgi:hypothetical protein
MQGLNWQRGEEVKGEGLKGAVVDEGCNRVMKDRMKWMEGGMESTETNKLDVFITREIPNKQLKNQVTYDYRTPIHITSLSCSKSLVFSGVHENASFLVSVVKGDVILP